MTGRRGRQRKTQKNDKTCPTTSPSGKPYFTLCSLPYVHCRQKRRNEHARACHACKQMCVCVCVCVSGGSHATGRLSGLRHEAGSDHKIWITPDILTLLGEHARPPQGIQDLGDVGAEALPKVLEVGVLHQPVPGNAQACMPEEANPDTNSWLSAAFEQGG